MLLLHVVGKAIAVREKEDQSSAADLFRLLIDGVYVHRKTPLGQGLGGKDTQLVYGERVLREELAYNGTLGGR